MDNLIVLEKIKIKIEILSKYLITDKPETGNECFYRNLLKDIMNIIQEDSQNQQKTFTVDEVREIIESKYNSSSGFIGDYKRALLAEFEKGK